MLALLPLIAIASTASPQDDDRRILELQQKLYQRQDVTNFCLSNPNGIYPVEIIVDNESITLTVRCVAWHAWMALQTAKQ